MTNKSTMLLEHNLKQLKLPTFLREYDKLASQCASEGADHPDYLLRLSELELIDRHHRMVERRDQSSPLPDDQESRHLRLPVYAVPEQGSGAGTMRVHQAPPQRHRSRQQWHRQDPYRPRSRSGCVSEGTVRGLHHRRCSGSRADRGQGRTASAQPAEKARTTQASDHRRTGLRALVQDWRRAALRGVQASVTSVDRSW